MPLQIDATDGGLRLAGELDRATADELLDAIRDRGEDEPRDGHRGRGLGAQGDVVRPRGDEGGGVVRRFAVDGEVRVRRGGLGHVGVHLDPAQCLLPPSAHA